MNSSAESSFGQVIASRIFEVKDQPGRTAELRLGAPQMDETDVFCPVQLLGVGDQKVHRIYGVDTLQALGLGLAYVEALLARLGDQILWEGEPAHQSMRLRQ